MCVVRHYIQADANDFIIFLHIIITLVYTTLPEPFEIHIYKIKVNIFCGIKFNFHFIKVIEVYFYFNYFL